MRAGTLRHRVIVQRDVAEIGAESKQYDDYLKNQPANVTDVAGGQMFRGKQLESTTTHAVEMRFDARIKPDMVIIDHMSRTLTINSILDFDGRQRDMILQCVELVV